MKKSNLLFVLALWILSINTTTAQQILFKNQPKDSVVRSNPQMAGYDCVPGEIIVKFKDNVQIKSTGAKLKSASVVTDALQTKYNVQKTEAIFPGETRLKSVQMLTTPNGQQFIRPSLHNIYKLLIADPKQVMNAISDFKADTANVIYAEPNYIVSICNDKPVGPILTNDDILKMQSAMTPLKNGSDPIVNDPLYDQQWYIPEVKADLVWPQTKGDTTMIIAILDTGVDWLHPDLKNKIWNNPSPSTNTWPDGILNDIHGWDFVNKDNNPTDDNSHGTHVAGIAAAETNNGIGIAGVCPNAKIMPVKVFQSSGKGDVATISKGINYAASHGATVINMSFGSYTRSLAMEDALSNAYASTTLVAAAGNDNFPIGPKKAAKCNEKNDGATFYPAALSYVIGVESPDACFSNYDQDGPTFSEFVDLLNYEMKAPGTNILSTVPNGGYRVYQGTSMAAPIISGLVALYRKIKPSSSQELLYGDFINSIGTYVDIQKAISSIPVPKLGIVSYEIKDTLDGDRDGRPDVGETIEFKVKVRNTWGQANDVKVGIAFKEFEDPTTATILNSEATIGSISEYATRFNTVSLKIKLASDIADGRVIGFDLKTWYGDHQGETSQPITINIENGIELRGIISSDMTLYPNKQYIVTDNLVIAAGTTLTIKPGTTLKLSENKVMVIDGTVIALGKPDSTIVFTKRDLYNSWGSMSVTISGFIDMNYCYLSYGGGGGTVFGTAPNYGTRKFCSIKNSYFNNNLGGISGWNSLYINKCVISNTFSYNALFNSMSLGDSILNTNIINNFSSCYRGGAFKLYYVPYLLNNSLFSNYNDSQEINYSTVFNTWAIIKFVTIQSQHCIEQ